MAGMLLISQFLFYEFVVAYEKHTRGDQRGGSTVLFATVVGIAVLAFGAAAWLLTR